MLLFWRKNNAFLKERLIKAVNVELDDGVKFRVYMTSVAKIDTGG